MLSKLLGSTRWIIIWGVYLGKATEQDTVDPDRSSYPIHLRLLSQARFKTFVGPVYFLLWSKDFMLRPICCAPVVSVHSLIL